MNKKLLALGISVAALAGCGGGTLHRDQPPPRHAPAPVHHPAPSAAPTQVHVPPGHMPPAGKCRIWYQGRPPGQQGPIGECAQLAGRVPAGAVLISGGAAPAQPAVVTPVAVPVATPVAKPVATPAAQTTSAANLKIPPGHMPPKGKCRIWYPGQPPGKQPAVGDCSELERKVPQGAVLVRG